MNKNLSLQLSCQCPAGDVLVTIYYLDLTPAISTALSVVRSLKCSQQKEQKIYPFV